MMNTPKSLSLIFALTFVAASAGKTLAEADRPNILYFYVDDMGWGSIGPNGQAARKAARLPYVRTPNIDRLAAEGINFTRGYGCHVCSPARSSQQSGFHQGHTFADRNDPNNAKKAMRADDVLMGDALAEAGYVTGYWGKWGYGGSKDRTNPTIDNVQTLPTSHGYEYVLAELHHVRAHTFFQPTLWQAPASSGSVGGVELVPNSLARYRNNSDYPATPSLQDHTDYPETAYCDDYYAMAALDFVRTQGQNFHETGQPFFGLLAVQIPHAPFEEVTRLPEWDRAYADDPLFADLADQTRQWAAMVTRIDAHFGNILAALEDPNNDGDPSDSIVENTLVVFQSDNGGPRGPNNVELDANGGLRGNKGSIYEGGIRVPLVVRWPARIHDRSELKAGTHCDRVVDVTDLLPTFCELAGTPAPLGVDGVSIAPTLCGTEAQRDRDFIIHEAGDGTSIIRNDYKLIRSKKGAIALYDLRTDHREANNIADAHPEMVNELETLLLGERVLEPQWFATTYHHWKGGIGADISDPDNWSDYVYANAGITYMKDDGAPKLAWIAHMENGGTKTSVARADGEVRLLALAICGNPSENAKQVLTLGPNAKLTGRNEIRIGDHGVLQLSGASLSTLRWIDVLPGGALTGSGRICGTIYNNGRVVPDGKRTPIRLDGDYNQSDNGLLMLSPGSGPQFVVSGRAKLDGRLVIDLEDHWTPTPGTLYPLLSAHEINGMFSNPENVVVTDRARFKIRYTDTTVALVAE